MATKTTNRKKPVPEPDEAAPDEAAPPPVEIVPLPAANTRVVPIGSLTPYPRNPKKHDIPALRASLRKYGLYRPIAVQESTGFIIAGNGTHEAAALEGYTEIAAVFLDVDDDTAARIVAADNRTHDLGGYDERILADLLSSLAEAEAGLAGTGYDTDTLDALLSHVSDLDELGEDLLDAQRAPVPGLPYLPAIRLDEHPAGEGEDDEDAVPLAPAPKMRAETAEEYAARVARAQATAAQRAADDPDRAPIPGLAEVVLICRAEEQQPLSAAVGALRIRLAPYVPPDALRAGSLSLAALATVLRLLDLGHIGIADVVATSVPDPAPVDPDALAAEPGDVGHPLARPDGAEADGVSGDDPS